MPLNIWPFGKRGTAATEADDAIERARALADRAGRAAAEGMDGLDAPGPVTASAPDGADGGRATGEVAERRTIDIGTDVATLVIHHPETLAHRADHPIAWYAEGFAFEAEAREGRLVAWGTGADGGYRVRFVRLGGEGDGLLASERPHAAGHAEFRLRSDLGHVFLDNTDGLPGEEQQVALADERRDLAFPLPNGLYRVRVTAIAEPEGETPDFVVAFTPVDEEGWDAVPVHVRPPELRGLERGAGAVAPPEGEPRALELSRHDAAERLAMPPPSRRHEAIDPDAPVPIVPGGGLALLPGETHGARITTAYYEALHEPRTEQKRFPALVHRAALVAPSLEDGATATLCEVRGVSHSPGLGEGSLRVNALGFARLRFPDGPPDPGRADGREGPVFAIAERIATADPPDGPLPPDAETRLRALIDRCMDDPGCMRVAPRSPGFERERVAAMRDPLALLGWLVRNARMDPANRLALWSSPPVERLEALERHIAGSA